MFKRIIYAFTFSLFLVALGGCGNEESSSPSPINGDSTLSNDSQFVEYGVAGNIMEITTSNDDKILGIIKIEGPENNGAKYKQAVITVTPDTKIAGNDPMDFDQLEIGMYVNVFFADGVKESFPVQATARQLNIIPDQAK